MGNEQSKGFSKFVTFTLFLYYLHNQHYDAFILQISGLVFSDVEPFIIVIGAQMLHFKCDKFNI